MQKWIVQAAMPILGALALLLVLIGVGRATRAALHDRATFMIAVSDIDCDPPESMTRTEFLAEVRQLAELPERVCLLDEKVTGRLARAFALHPWVESVRRVEIGVRGPRLHIELVKRQAVLAVCLSGDTVPQDGSALIETWSGTRRNSLMPARAVDCSGILLPVSAVHSRLPVLTTNVNAPGGPAGQRWGDARVSIAAATVGFLRPHLAQLDLADCDLEIVQGQAVFRKPGVRVVWGHAPGQERVGEAPAKVKLQRLLDYQAGHNGLESLEHDVRLLAYQGHFPLPQDAQP